MLAILATSVVIFLVDDVSAYERTEGLVQTPVIDSLASQGTEFTRFYSNPACVVTRYSLHLSSWNARSMGSACDGISSNTLTVPEIAGLTLYKATGKDVSKLMVGKSHMGVSPLSGTYLDLHETLGADNVRAMTPNNVKQSCGPGVFGYFNWQRIDDGSPTISTEYVTLAQADAFKDWWTKTKGDRFALVNLQAAHTPHHNPPAEALPPGWPTPTSPRERFEAMLASADLAIGDMLTVIDSQTYVMVLSDNGTTEVATHPSHDRDKQKHTLFEGGSHVFCILTGPGIPVGTNSTVRHVVDVLPTVAALFGGSVSTDGQNMLDPLSQRGWAYLKNIAGDEAVVTEQWKLHVPSDVLYDLSVDPWEENPIEPNTEPEAYGRLLQYLAEARG